MYCFASIYPLILLLATLSDTLALPYVDDPAQSDNQTDTTTLPSNMTASPTDLFWHDIWQATEFLKRYVQADGTDVQPFAYYANVDSGRDPGGTTLPARFTLRAMEAIYRRRLTPAQGGGVRYSLITARAESDQPWRFSSDRLVSDNDGHFYEQMSFTAHHYIAAGNDPWTILRLIKASPTVPRKLANGPWGGYAVQYSTDPQPDVYLTFLNRDGEVKYGIQTRQVCWDTSTAMILSSDNSTDMSAFTANSNSTSTLTSVVPSLQPVAETIATS